VWVQQHEQQQQFCTQAPLQRTQIQCKEVAVRGYVDEKCWCTI